MIASERIQPKLTQTNILRRDGKTERMSDLIPKSRDNQQRLHFIFRLTVCFVVNSNKRRIESIRTAGGNVTLLYPCTQQVYQIKDPSVHTVIPFKDFILNICSLRIDEIPRNVRFRVNSAFPGLHSVDASYSQDCKT